MSKAESDAKYYQKHRARIRRMQNTYNRKRYASMTPLEKSVRLAQGHTHWTSYTVRLRIEAFEHYGGMKCFCCGETNPLFLTLDHINNDGGEWRKRMANAAGQNQKGKRYLQGTNFYLWLHKNNYPALALQVACYNCNLGRARNRGVCPHVS